MKKWYFITPVIFLATQSFAQGNNFNHGINSPSFAPSSASYNGNTNNVRYNDNSYTRSYSTSSNYRATPAYTSRASAPSAAAAYSTASARPVARNAYIASGNTYAPERASMGARGVTPAYTPTAVATTSSFNTYALSSTSSTSPSSVSGAGSRLRYNYVTRKSYPYRFTPLAKYKSFTHYSDNVRMRHRRHFFPQIYGPLFQAPYYPIICFSDYFIYDLADGYSNDNTPAILSSYDGYIVYDNDTLSGIITLDSKQVFLEKNVNANKENAYSLNYKDVSLKSIVLFNGNNELHLARLAGDESRLWRVLHTGKLNLYDDRYSFPTPENVHKSRIKVTYGTQGAVKDINNKRQFVDAINTVYGTHPSAKGMSWNELLTYLDGLD